MRVWCRALILFGILVTIPACDLNGATPTAEVTRQTPAASTPVVSAIPVTTPQMIGPYTQELAELGTAYAQDAATALLRVETEELATVGQDNSQWASKVQDNLRIGYAPKSDFLATIPYASIADLLKVKAAGNRDLVTTVRTVVQPGSKIVQVKWHFAITMRTVDLAGDGSAQSVSYLSSYSVVTPSGEVAFDSLLSMPLLTVPIFDVDHF